MFHPPRRRPRFGIEAVCQDARGLNGESNRRAFRLCQPSETAEDEGRRRGRLEHDAKQIQALRAWLRSTCPSGTKRHSPIEDSHEISVYASSPRGLAASWWHREQESRTQARRLLPLPRRHASLRSSAVGVSYLLEMSKLQSPFGFGQSIVPNGP
jgi:hypothetical protein